MTDPATSRAREANAPAEWDKLWKTEGPGSWRGQALGEVYERISFLLREVPDPVVADLGGGNGQLAQLILQKRPGSRVTVFDSSEEAVRTAKWRGALGVQADLASMEFPLPFARWVVGQHYYRDGRFETYSEHGGAAHNVVVATEVLEHLDDATLEKVLCEGARVGVAFFSVPNDRLGPEEEPQHCRKWTALGFKQHLKKFFARVRVECLGPVQPETRAPAFLLAVCTSGHAAETLFQKSFRLSVTLPVRDEAADLPRTLASFRGVADEIVVGVDPRTKDATREEARKYAEVVFDLEDPEGRSQPDPPVREEGKDSVHFAWLRNQCIERCSGDWIFMTEGHEFLSAGVDALLRLDQIVSPGAKVGSVMRRGSGQRWAFPWLTRRSDARLRYERHTHNCLAVPDGVLVEKLPMIQTTHLRDHERERTRAVQRKAQNRLSLLDDWSTRGNANSLFYLGTEWRPYDVDRSIARFREYIQVSKNGSGRYQARLILSKELAEQGRVVEAREALMGATADDWSRTEHWLWLGDLAFAAGQYEQAEQFYRYSATYLGRELPFTQWWIDEASYTYLPAQRLAMTLSFLGNYREASEWARRVVDLLPSDAPDEAREEALANLALLEEEAPHEPSQHPGTD